MSHPYWNCWTHALPHTLSLPSHSQSVAETCVSTASLHSPPRPLINLRASTSFLSHSPGCPSRHHHPPLVERMNRPLCLVYHALRPPSRAALLPFLRLSGPDFVHCVSPPCPPAPSHRPGPHGPHLFPSVLLSQKPQEPPILRTDALRPLPCTHSPSPTTTTS